MRISLKEVEEAYQDAKTKKKGTKDSVFASLFLSKEHGLETGDALSQVDSSFALGCNAYAIDTQKKNLYLYVALWSTDYKGWKNPYKILSTTGLRAIFSDATKEELQNQFLRRLKADLQENQSVINKVFLYFLFNGNPIAAENSVALANQRESVEEKKHLIDEFFEGRNIALAIDYRSNLTSNLSGQSIIRKTYQYNLPVKNTVEHKNSQGARLFVAMVPLLSFHKMYLDMGYRLFDRNIRAGLSGENSPNKAIYASLKSITVNGDGRADDFLFHHNGIAISVGHLEWEGIQMKITEPRVLNGAQTVSTLARFVEEMDRNKKFDQIKKKLGEIQVLTRIIDAKGNNAFVTEVTINNNRQNPVEPWNLRASDGIQLEIADKLAEELNVFYERQENAFSSLSTEDLEELNIQQSKSVEIRRLAQTILASQGAIDKITSLREVFENPNLYHNVFHKGLLQVDARAILLLYKVSLRLQAGIQAIIETGPNKYYYMNKAKNLVWALLIQALQNDPKIEEHLSNFGTSLAVETHFKDTLKDLAAKRLKPILADFVDSGKNSQFIQEQKFGFFRTKSSFDVCMKIANQKFGWSKKSI